MFESAGSNECLDTTVLTMDAPADVSGPSSRSTLRLPRLGEAFDSYRIVTILGCGGMGVVTLVHDEREGSLLATKFLDPDHARDPEMVRRFRRETDLLGRCRHSNVVEFRDAGEFEGLPWLAMEYVRGRPLASGSGARRSNPREVAEVGLQVARALDHLHTRGIVHRDVKPANIVVERNADRPPRAVLVDFGLAQATGSEADHLDGGISGTPLYMPPEQLDPAAAADPRSDLYALGATLLDLLGERPVATLRQFLETRVAACPRRRPVDAKLLPGVPLELQHLLDRLVQPDPADRPPTARSVATSLDRFLNGRDATVRCSRASLA